MTIEDTQRLRAVAQRIIDASSPEVQAEIDSLKRKSKPPAWASDAARAMQARYGGIRAAKPIRGPAPASLEAAAAPLAACREAAGRDPMKRNEPDEGR